jgi:hypothetical protein
MGADVMYILDKRNSSIVMFDVNGNYLNQLDRRGNGPGEYLDIADFTVSRLGNGAYRGSARFMGVRPASSHAA